MPIFSSFGGRTILLASLLVTTLLTGGKRFGILEPLELRSFDAMIRLQPDQAPDPRLLIVGMTEVDIQQYGWPLSDQVLATVLEKLQQHQPAVIGLDLYRSTTQLPGQAALMAQLKAENVIAIMNVGSDRQMGEVPPPPNVPWERVGFNDLVVDPDGVIRRSLLFVDAVERSYYSFALRVVLAYFNDPPYRFISNPNTLEIGGSLLPALKPGSGGYQTIDANGYQVILDYRSRHSPARQVTISQVLSDRIPADWVRGNIVLIGTTAPSLKDQLYTPYSAAQTAQFTQPGVVVHAQIISHLLDAIASDQALYRFWPQWGETLWLWGWALVAGMIVWPMKRPRWIFCASGFVILVAVGISGISLSHRLWLPIVEPLVGIIATVGLVTTQKLLYRSTHDSLTGLAGREVFLQQIQRALHLNRQAPANHPVMVAFLGVDRFRLINQSLGHAVGDRALLTLVERLQHILPASAQISRVGGDEFAVLFQQMSPTTVEQILDTLQQALAEPLYLNQQRLAITASTGLTIAPSGYDHQAEDLLRDAHTAMYRAKTLGTYRYEIFSTGMRTEAVNRLSLESDLLDALEKQEFCLYYQPIICLQTGKISGFEALVRWQQAYRGFVLPNAFIPIAEETGLILPLGQWVFREACHQLKQWQQLFPQYPLTISINLSSRQFNQTDLVRQIESSLIEVGIEGQQVRLEITESMVMDNVQAAIDLMLRLKELGLQLSIDDFGTGYSSLSYLHRFPMDTLKVDRSFVSRMEQSGEDREIVHTIIALGHKLGMDIVAEGVETAAQMAILRQAGCQYGQGYFFARPLSSEDAAVLLAQDPIW